MKTFLYRLTSVRDGKTDGVIVVGGHLYYHDQILTVIEAEDAEHAARALNITIIDSFDRSSVERPTVYYTSKYHSENPQGDHKDGYFFLSLKELESGDEITHPDLQEKLRLKVTAPKLAQSVP